MDVTSEDLRAVAADIKDYIGERVDRVESQLSTLNGRVSKQGEEIAEHRVRLRGLQRKVYAYPDKQTDDENRPAFTKHDVKVVGGLIVGIGVLIETAHRLFALLQK